MLHCSQENSVGRTSYLTSHGMRTEVNQVRREFEMCAGRRLKPRIVIWKLRKALGLHASKNGSDRCASFISISQSLSMLFFCRIEVLDASGTMMATATGAPWSLSIRRIAAPRIYSTVISLQCRGTVAVQWQWMKGLEWSIRRGKDRMHSRWTQMIVNLVEKQLITCRRTWPQLSSIQGCKTDALLRASSRIE